MSTFKDKFINVNKYSRPGLKLDGVKKIIIHWTANPGASASNHVTYFGKTLIEQNNKLPENKRRYASAHLFVDKTEALCIIPLNEVAYQANDGTYRGISELKPNANFLAIGIEMCVEKDGTIHKDTITRTEDVAVELCKKFKLDPIKDIVRHYDVTHKSCPTPWVTDGKKFTDFKQRVANKMKGADVKVNNNQPSAWAKDIWEKQISNGYFDGTNPQGNITREQTAAVIERVVNNIQNYIVSPLEKRVKELENEIKKLKEGGK